MCNVIRPGACLLVAVFSLIVSAPARASQEPGATGAPEAEEADQQPKPQPKPTPQQPGTPTPAPRPGNERQPERQPEGRPINLQIEVAITDQVGSEPAEKKIVSMIVADRAWGRVRASGVAQLKETPGPVPVRLNVDGRPAIQPNDTIRLELTLEYQPLPPAAEADAARRPSQLHESLTVILHSGKPLTVSRAVDPFTNRRTSVDITATIVK